MRYVIRYTKTESHPNQDVRSPQYAEREYDTLEAAQEAASRDGWGKDLTPIWTVDVVEKATEIVYKEVPKFKLPKPLGSVMLFILDSDVYDGKGRVYGALVRTGSDGWIQTFSDRYHSNAEVLEMVASAARGSNGKWIVPEHQEAQAKW